MRGLFVAIEGGDGSGKGTQADLLERRASTEGYDVLRISFPQYGQFSASFAEEYLNGKYGGIDEVSPELASLAYAVDRFEAAENIRTHLDKPKSLVIADRYVASNLAHQGTKISNKTSRKTFYDRIMTLEYSLLNLPQPDANIVLLVPSNIAQRNVDQKAVRSYTDKKRDLHEADASHLEKAKANYQELCEAYPDNFISIECMNGDTMRTIEDIREDIWSLVSSKLKSTLKEL